MDKIWASLCDRTLASKHLFSVQLLPEKLEKENLRDETLKAKKEYMMTLKVAPNAAVNSGSNL